VKVPDYYDGKGGMQPFDVIDAFGLDFYEGNVVKYICRWRKKNGLDDLYKARTYINQVIKRAEAEAEPVTADIQCGLRRAHRTAHHDRGRRMSPPQPRRRRLWAVQCPDCGRVLLGSTRFSGRGWRRYARHWRDAHGGGR
jgi:hypothetical protein